MGAQAPRLTPYEPFLQLKEIERRSERCVPFVDQRTDLLLFGRYSGEIVNGKRFKSGDRLDGLLQPTLLLCPFGRLDLVEVYVVQGLAGKMRFQKLYVAQCGGDFDDTFIKPVYVFKRRAGDVLMLDLRVTRACAACCTAPTAVLKNLDLKVRVQCARVRRGL